MRAAAAAAPGAAALVDGGRVVTWAELAEEVARAVAWLDREGWANPDRLAGRGVQRPVVALTGDASAAGVVRLLALIETGLAPLVLHPRWTAAERAAAVATAGVVPILDSVEKWAATPAGPALAAPPDDERALAAIFTSGSAGTPRAAVLSRRAVVAAAAASAANLGWFEDDRWLLSLTPAHVGGLSVLTRALLARTAIVLAPAGPFDVGGFIETVAASRVTLASLVPTMLHRLLECTPVWTPPRALRAILLGGAAATPALLARAAERDLPVLTTYGLTETCAQVATQRPGAIDRDPRGATPPLPGVEVRIVAGEIQVRGPSLFSGYLTPGGIDLPLEPGGWFATGDLGRVDEAGNLHVHGRSDDRIRSSGEGVDPHEIETVLLDFGGVAEACVFAVADEQRGEVVAAALVPAGPVLDLTGLAQHCSRRLAAFKRPRLVVVLDRMPVAPSGKVARRAVAASVGDRLVPFDITS